MLPIVDGEWTSFESARASIHEHGDGEEDEAFTRLIQMLHYVDGNYEDKTTFAALRKELGDARRPALH